jgi:hypothetical protein
MLRPKNQYKAKSNFFHGSFIKFVLAIIAICSFSLAFNYDYKYQLKSKHVFITKTL